MSGLSSILIAGTCYEYGSQAGQLSEALEVLPNTPYAHAKSALYKQLKYLQKDHFFSLTWMRIFYIHGQGKTSNTLMSQIKRAVDSSEKVFNMSFGEQLLDYLPVTKVAEYISKLAVKQGNFDVVNICSGNPISVRRLVEQWIKEYDWDIALNLGYHPYRDYESMAFWGDRSKLASILELK
jgi:UDP-glucose 4-epimerase